MEIEAETPVATMLADWNVHKLKTLKENRSNRDEDNITCAFLLR